MKLLLLFITLAVCSAATSQNLYRYKDDNGDWQFSDRPPADERDAESQRLTTRNYTPEVFVESEKSDNGAVLVATNEWHCPIQVRVEFVDVINIDAELVEPFDAVLPPDSVTELTEIMPQGKGERFSYRIKYFYVSGDPEAQRDTDYLYAMPFARGTKFNVTQAYPTAITHADSYSRYAIDFAMPEGTPVYSVRDGVVFATSYEHYSGGTDRERDLPKANVVRIAHDDGTMAVYAHLSWNAIRVKPGQRVRRGQYIADSGNTGFSSGPHLHFALLFNTGMKIESVPLLFAGSGGQSVVPKTGQEMFNIE